RTGGVLVADVRAARQSAGKHAQIPQPSPVTPRIKVRDISEFRKAHDIPQKIRTRLATMRTDNYVTEEEMRQLCDVAVQHWRRNADLPEFSENKFKLDGVVYWASKGTIHEMKKITGRA
ncbi:MAG: hypothetical protein KKA68_21115, partial [Gammaproteobacteria bacterium]|nr:hypothetical protein [Gammaproteobacteria bacterium]